MWIVNGTLTNTLFPSIPEKSAEKPYPKALWRVEDGQIATDIFPEIPEKSAEKPYPKALWRINPLYNGGMPYHELLPDISGVHYNPVNQSEYIIVYDMNTKQTGFTTNGLAVLCPTSCLITETLNGKWELTMEHPIDAEGKYQYLVEKNIIKAMGQLYTIERIDEQWVGNSGKISVRAEHIFYQLNDPWIYPQTRLAGKTSRAIINTAYHVMGRNTEQGQAYYDYEYNGDVEIPAGTDTNKWNPLTDGCTLVDLILGSNGIIATAGGELYRDNFYFSVNKEMENAKKDAFDIRVGLNLKGIRRVVDTSSCCLYFRGYDSYGSWSAISWDYTTLTWAFPHSIIRTKNFSYNIDEETLPEGWTEDDKIAISAQLLDADVVAYFNAHYAPLVSYTVDLQDVRNNPDYAELSEHFEYKVGNTGRLYDPRFGGAITLKITKTVKDAIKGITTEVCFGDLLSFTRPVGYTTAIMDLNYVSQGGAMHLRDRNGDILYDRNANSIMQKTE